MMLSARIDSLRAASDVDGLIALIPYAAWLGMRGRALDSSLEFAIDPRPDQVGNARLPAVHGGVVAAFMEHAAIFEMLWREAPERIPHTINFSLDYLRSARMQTLFAACEVSRVGSRVAQLQVHCWQADRKHPVAVARAHMQVDTAAAALWPQ